MCGFSRQSGLHITERILGFPAVPERTGFGARTNGHDEQRALHFQIDDSVPNMWVGIGMSQPLTDRSQVNTRGQKCDRGSAAHAVQVKRLALRVLTSARVSTHVTKHMRRCTSMYGSSRIRIHTEVNKGKRKAAWHPSGSHRHHPVIEALWRKTGIDNRYAVGVRIW